MTKSDWIEVGLRLLGVFFLVTAVATVWRTTVVLAMVSGKAPGDAALGLAAYALPLVEIAAGVLLLYVRWPRERGEHDRPARQTGPRQPMPEYLEDSFGQMEQGEGGPSPP